MINSTKKTARNTAPSQAKPQGTSRQYQDQGRRKSVTLTVDGESKLLIGNMVTFPINERPATTTSKRKPITENTYTLFNVKSNQGHKDPSQPQKEPIQDQKEVTQDHKELSQNNKGPSQNNKGFSQDHQEHSQDQIKSLQDHKEPSYDHTPCNKLILELKEEIKSLKKENNNLEISIKVTCTELSLTKEEKQLLGSENVTLKETIETLECSNLELKKECIFLQEKFKKKKAVLKNEKETLEKTLNEIRKELEAKIIEIRAKHRAEVLELEEKNRLLKVYLSENLKINSWERQQEIQRISNDLEKCMEKERSMKNHLNKLMTQNGSLRYCSKCQSELLGNDSNQNKKLTREKELNNFKKLSVDFKESSKANLGGHKSAESNYY